MAINLADIERDTRDVPVHLRAGTLTVTYAPSELTAEFVDRASGNDSVREMAGMLAEIMRDWDLERDGAKVPITEDSLAKLSLPLLLDPIMAAITADQGDLGEAGSPSSGT